MKQLKRELETDDAELLKEYLARGGKITVCEAGARTENIQVGQWTRNRRRGPSKKPPAAKE
jgi:predicted peroxiredoxin